VLLECRKERGPELVEGAELFRTQVKRRDLVLPGRNKCAGVGVVADDGDDRRVRDRSAFDRLKDGQKVRAATRSKYGDLQRR
jgi:hypothetical protein